MLRVDTFSHGEKDSWRSNKNYNMDLYNIAYKASISMYKEEMSSYESKALKVMSEMGMKISRWKNESTLFALVSKEYPDAIYQYHSEWLGKQSLDIFIPSLSLGIEYQGQQHYEPIEFFGGEEAFKKTIKRDKMKERLCKNNNVHLLLWKYDEVISLNKLKKKIGIVQGTD